MRWLIKYIGASVGKKQIMGFTGLVWYGFLFAHLVGNLGLTAGADRFNSYGNLLQSTLREITIPVEILFLACLLTHIVIAIWVSLENRAARPIGYVKYKSAGAIKKLGRGATLSSRSMIYAGLGIAIFMTLHILRFRFGVAAPHLVVNVNGAVMRDVYTVVMTSFANPFFTVFYCIAFLLLATHLWHGVESSFQSAGLNHPKYFPLIRVFSKLYAIVIGAGFNALAVWAFLQGVHS